MRLLFLIVVIAALRGSALARPTAEELYDQGQRAYDHSDWPTAIEKWQRSYDLSSAPGLLFNLAQAHRLAGDCEHALASYRHFVELEPNSEQRGLAEDFIHELEPTCGGPSSMPSTDRRTEQRSRTLKLAGLVTSGAGVASIVIGAAIGHHASTLGDEVSRACAIDPGPGCDWQVEKGIDATGRREAALGYTLDGLGVAAIVGGAVMFYFGDRRGEVLLAPLTVRSREGGAVISWSGSW